jgi:transposase InsO family protein
MASIECNENQAPSDFVQQGLAGALARVDAELRFSSVREAQHGISTWMMHYNQERPHSSLEDQTPEEAYLAMAA